MLFSDLVNNFSPKWNGYDVTTVLERKEDNVKQKAAILREAWNTSQQTEDRREKIQALSLAKECYSMKLHLLTNATVLDDAIRFVSSFNRKKPNETKVEKINDNIRRTRRRKS
jgi:hypothetical protein